ncbi:MAG: transporter substrate-binding domain-containing protein, partial [Arenicellales bacterium]
MKIYAAILKKFTSAAIIMIATGMLTCSAADTVSLTDEEAAWLSEHPVIRFAIDPDNAPIEWINRKNIERGMSFDMLRLVEQRLGINFERVESAGWIESIQMLQNRDVDILPAFRRAKEWQQQLLFSRPWFSLPGVILSEQKYQTLEELEGRKVAVVHDYIWDDLVSKNDDNLIIIRASDSHRCIDLVVQGGAEAMVGDMASVTWILNRSGATHLRIRPVAGEYLDLSVAIRSDWPLF